MKHRPTIGIEISTEEIRAAFVKPSGGGVMLAGVASAPVPPEAVDGEGLLNPQIMSEAVRYVCSLLDQKVDTAVVGLTNGSLVARVMEIPPVPDSDIRSVLRGEMDHYRILPAGQSAFDYFRLPELPNAGEAEGEEAVTRVLLMGAEERLVSSYRSVMDSSGLRLVAVEPGSIAALRTLYPALETEPAFALVNISAGGTEIFITTNGELHFYRRIDTAVPDLRVQIAQEAAPTATRNKGGMLAATEEEVEDDVPQVSGAADKFNRQAISLLMTEVQRSLDYFVREFPNVGESLSVQFAVDAPEADELFAMMTQYLRSSAVMVSLQHVIPTSVDAEAEISGSTGGRYAVAVGLALRGMGGAYSAAPALDLSTGDRVVVERRMAPKAMFASAAASLVILAGTVTAAFILNGNIARQERKLDQTRSEVKLLKAEHAALVAQLERQAKLTDTIQGSAKPIPQGLDFFAASIAKRGCLTGVTIDTSGLIFITGEARSPRVVADIMDTINLSPMLQPIRLTNLLRLDPRMGGEGLQFELQTGFASSPRIEPTQAASAATASPDSVQQGGG